MSIVIYERRENTSRATQHWLDQRGIPYQVVDMTADPTLRAFFEAHGFYEAPVVAVNKNDGVVRFEHFRPDLLAIYCVEEAA